jgi:hypothetical protein
MRHPAPPAIALALLLIATPAASQSVSRAPAAAVPDIRVTAGLVRMFLDEPALPAAGGGVRLPISAHLAVEPEVLRLAGDRFDGWNIDGNLSWTFGGEARVRPYVIGGVGAAWQHEAAIHFTHREASVSGGVGIRVRAGARSYLAVEGRLGSAAFPRLTITIGARVR